MSVMGITVPEIVISAQKKQKRKRRTMKARLIDADKLKDVKFQDSANLYKWGWNSAIDAIIENAPTIDAVEVVRCGDCRHLTADGRCLEFADDFLRPSVNDYCSYGEREENVD